MKKALCTFGLLALLFAMPGLSAFAQDNSTVTWKGWITDQACAAKCASMKGNAWVFVDSESKKIVKIHNQDAVHPDSDSGQEVSVTGHLEQDGSVHIERIAPAM